MTAALGLAVPAGAVEPVPTPGNPKCADLGLMGLKLDGVPVVGRYDLPGLNGAFVDVLAVRNGGRRFDWSSNFGLDQVIVKGGPAANVYPTADARSGEGFEAPRAGSGAPPQISHVDFCYDTVERPAIESDTDVVDGARGVHIDDVPLTALPASLLNVVAGAGLVNDAGTGLRFSELVGDPGLEFAGTGLRFSGTGLRFTGTGLRFTGTGLRYSGTSIRFSGTGLRFTGTGLRFTGTGLRFTDAGLGGFVQIRAAGTGLRFTGTGLRFTGTGMRFSDLPGWDVPLSDLQPPEGLTWDDVFVAIGTYQGYPPQNVTFGQLLDALDQDFSGFSAEALAVIEALATMSLLDLDPNGAVLREVSLVGLLLGGTLLGDIPLPGGQPWCELIDPADAGCTDADIGDATVLGLNLAGLRSDNIPLDGIALDAITFDPDSVLADLLDDAGVAGDLFVPAEPGDTLATYVLRGIDALNVPWEQLPLATDFDVRQYALGERVSFTASWSQAASATTPVEVGIPTGFVEAAEGPQCSVSGGTCTVVPLAPGRFDVAVAGVSDVVDVVVSAAFRPGGLYGTADPPPAGGTFDVVAGASSGSFAVAVADPWAGQDPPPIEADVLYFGQVTGGGIDRYDLDVTGFAPGSHVAVRLSNLTDDADLVLYRSAGTGLRFSGTGMRFTGTGLRFSGTGLRYSGDSSDGGVENREPETLDDVPIDADRLVEDVSANRTTTPEAADGFTDPFTDGFEVQVAGFNETETDYVVRVAVTEFADDCSAGAPAGASVSFQDPAGADTAVLFAADRFDAADRQAISEALDRLAAMWPITVGTVTTTGTDWTTEDGICSVAAANAVAEAVAADVQALAVQQPTIQHVMIIGGDDRLPFYRTPDVTSLANEATYAPVVGGQNPITSALATQHVLTDDIYGDDDPWPFLNRLYFTPDRGVGRLVESTADIIGQIDRFIAAGGLIDVDRAFTGGYDFLADVAVEIDALLADVSDDRTTLISDLAVGGVPDWTAAELSSALADDDGGAGLSIASIQAHMDQGRLLSAFGDAQGDSVSATEVVGPDVLPAGISGAVLFTAGCHAGLNQPYPAASRTDDWAEALAGGPAAFYLANTGYGYGLDQPGIAYSELLLAEFADLLESGGASVGLANAYAKQAFFAAQIEIDEYDEKSQMQLTVYGVPMYTLDAGAAAAATAAATSASIATATTAPDPVTGQPSAVVAIDTTFSLQPGADGTSYYAIESVASDSVVVETGLEASDGHPIQPRIGLDVTAADASLVARGAIVERLTGTRVGLADPTIARALFDNTATQDPEESGTSIFPTAFTNVHTAQTADGPRGRLVVVPAQYDSTDTGAEQLLLDSMEIRTYYASPGETDVVRPQFRDVSGGAVGDDILFRVEIDDPDGVGVTSTGVERVLVQYFDGATWHPVEMFPANGDRTEWSGGLPDGMLLGPPGTFIAMAVDGAANVATTSNKGAGYGVDGAPARAVAFVTGELGAAGWYVGVPTVELVGSAVDVTSEPPSHTVTLSDDPPFGYVAPFAITSEGVTTVSIDGEGAMPLAFEVKVDTRAPLVDLGEPIVVVRSGDVVDPATIVTCADPVPGSGLLDLDPEAASDCRLTVADFVLELPEHDPVGPFTLGSALARDVAGNESSESQSAVVLEGTEGAGGIFTSPVILGVIGASADDALVGLDGADPQPYAGPITITESTSVVVVVGEDQLSFDVVIDADGPVVGVSPEPAGTYPIDSVVMVTCTFDDGPSGSGLDAVVCGTETGTGDTSLTAALDTSSAGPKTFTASATDLAGNTTTVTFAYDVVDPLCDPVGDTSDPDTDIIRCRSFVNGDGTATLAIIVDGQIALDGVQYRLRLASSPDQVGALVKWEGGKTNGRELISATVTGDRLDFVVDLVRVGVAPGGVLYWFAEVQDGVPGKPTDGFLDRAPDNGWFELVT